MWRQGFDALEGALRPALEGVVASEQFAVAAGLLATARGAAQRVTERTTRRALHFVNLPAGSDITRLLAELGRLERKVSELTRQLDAARGGPSDGRPPLSERPPQPTQA